MKARNLSMLVFAVLAMLLMSPVAQAYMSANILYTETDLGGGSWQYDYTFQNTSSSGDSHPYLQTVKLLLGGDTTVTVLNMPANWTSYAFNFTPDIGTSFVTDYLEMYSGNIAADVAPGSTLGGFSFTSNFQLGNISYTAVFSNHGSPEDFADDISGTTAPVPIPGAVWLLGSGLAGLAGLRRRLGR